MTIKIDGLSYPKVGREWLKHKTLGPILRAVLRAQMRQDSSLFLDAVLKGENYSNLYKGFIDGTKAKYMVNISSAVRAPMDQAGKMGNFYDKKIWKKGIAAAVSEIENLMQANVAEKELKANKAFRAHHYGRMWYNRANFYKKWQKGKEMTKIKKFLGDTDGMVPLGQLNELYAALKYNPKASKKSLDAVATASGKTPREVKSIFAKFIKTK